MGLSLLTDLFTVCFWFGATTTLVGFVLGLGRHGPFHAPHAGHGPTLGHHADPAMSPLNLTSILAFLLVFGAVGLVLPAGVGALVALLVATAAGLVAGWLAFLFVARVLLRGQTFLEDEPIAGTLGTISIPIGLSRVGEIIYTRNGVRRSDGARSLDGEAIGEGEEVVILRYDNGIATVQRWRDFVQVSSPSGVKST
jgi:hypothetical protein